MYSRLVPFHMNPPRGEFSQTAFESSQRTSLIQADRQEVPRSTRVDIESNHAPDSTLGPRPPLRSRILPPRNHRCPSSGSGQTEDRKPQTRSARFNPLLLYRISHGLSLGGSHPLLSRRSPTMFSPLASIISSTPPSYHYRASRCSPHTRKSRVKTRGARRRPRWFPGSAPLCQSAHTTMGKAPRPFTYQPPWRRSGNKPSRPGKKGRSPHEKQAKLRWSFHPREFTP